MRLRKKPGTVEKILVEKDYLITDPLEYYGQWQNAFLNPNPLALEIGMGGGKFLTSLAKKNPHINYLGIEKKERLIEFSIEKIKALGLKNIKLLWYDANKIEEIFAEDEISYLYLNFSDPWPKNRHAKRRLTSDGFLEKYNLILKHNALLEVKTDNASLFEFTLNELLYDKWQLIQVALDLHAQKYFNGVMTEYEERFTSLGQNIYYLKAKNIKA